MTYTVRFEGETIRVAVDDWTKHQASSVRLVLELDGERMRLVTVEVSGGAISTIRERYRDDPLARDRSMTALAAVAVARLRRLDELGALPDQYAAETIAYRFDEDGLDEVLAHIDRKNCNFQARYARGLYCLAASGQGPTAIELVATAEALAGPTTIAACRRCNVPDDDVRCSHLTHIWTRDLFIGEPSEIDRRLSSAACDLGRAEVTENSGLCHLGGHECARMVFAETNERARPVDDPTALADALDFLDATWKLRWGRRLLPPVRHAVIARLAQSVDDAAEFRSRLVDLISVLDAFSVEPDDVLDPDARARYEAATVDEQGRPAKSLARLEAFFAEVLDPAALTEAKASLAQLRKINRLRAVQGGHTNADPGNAYKRLGIDRFATWPDQWRQLAGIAVAAITDLRRAIEAPSAVD